MKVSHLNSVSHRQNAWPAGLRHTHHGEDRWVARSSRDPTVRHDDASGTGVGPARVAKFYARRPARSFDWPMPAVMVGALMGGALVAGTISDGRLTAVSASVGALIGVIVDVLVYPARALLAYHKAGTDLKLEVARWEDRQAAFLRQYPDGIIATQEEVERYARSKDSGWLATTVGPGERL